MGVGPTSRLRRRRRTTQRTDVGGGRPSLPKVEGLGQLRVKGRPTGVATAIAQAGTSPIRSGTLSRRSLAMGILAWIVLGLVAGRWRSSSCRANKVAEFSSPSCSVSSVLSSGASWARTCSASATFQGSIYAASRSQSVEPYWCCSCTGSSLAAAPNPRLQRTRPAVDQHATFRLTKRTFSETAPRREGPDPDFHGCRATPPLMRRKAQSGP